MSTIIHELMKLNTEADSNEYLTKVLNPTNNRAEMGEVYTKVMGYDPLVHFDRGEVIELLNDFINDNSEYSEGPSRINVNDVADNALQYIAEYRRDSQADAIISALAKIDSDCANAFDAWYSEPVDGDDDEEDEEDYTDDEDIDELFDDDE